MRHLLRFFLAAALCVPLACLAQACNLADIGKTVAVLGYDGTLALIRERSCLGDRKNDKDPLVQTVDKALESSSEPFAAVAAGLNTLSAYAAARAPNSKREEDWVAISSAMQQGAKIFTEASRDVAEAERVKLAEQAIPRAWENIRSATQGELTFDGKPVKLLSPTECGKQVAPGACEPFNTQRDMIRVVNLATGMRDVSQRPSLELHLEDARLQLERWEAYRSKGQHQYFWEVLINSQFMGEDLCPTDPKTGIQRGFCAVPTSQFIVMHPDAGLRWVRSASQSSELKPAFIVEILGYYRWNWRSAKSAEMTDRFGASIAAAYTDVSTGKKWSYGPMVHFGSGYNLAFTKASGEKWGVLVSLNLAERYFGRKQEYVDYLKSLEKRGIGALLD